MKDLDNDKIATTLNSRINDYNLEINNNKEKSTCVPSVGSSNSTRSTAMQNSSFGTRAPSPPNNGTNRCGLDGARRHIGSSSIAYAHALYSHDVMDDQMTDFSRRTKEAEEVEETHSVHGHIEFGNALQRTASSGRVVDSILASYLPDVNSNRNGNAANASSSVANVPSVATCANNPDNEDKHHSDGEDEPPRVYCTEGTPMLTPMLISRASSMGELHRKRREHSATDDSGKQDTSLTKEGEEEECGVGVKTCEGTANATPQVWSRVSSPSSLSSYNVIGEAHPAESVISEFSRQPSGLISPSDLPDSPGHTVPPSPPPIQVTVPPTEVQPTSQRTADFVFFGNSHPALENSAMLHAAEDKTINYAMEGTPLEFNSRCTSISALTLDEPPIPKSPALRRSRRPITDGATLQHPTQRDSSNSRQENGSTNNGRSKPMQMQDSGLPPLPPSANNHLVRPTAVKPVPVPRTSFSRAGSCASNRSFRPIDPISFSSGASDTLKAYNTEGTPANLSKQGSYSDLSSICGGLSTHSDFRPTPLPRSRPPSRPGRLTSEPSNDLDDDDEDLCNREMSGLAIALGQASISGGRDRISGPTSSTSGSCIPASSSNTSGGGGPASSSNTSGSFRAPDVVGGGGGPVSSNTSGSHRTPDVTSSSMQQQQRSASERRDSLSSDDGEERLAQIIWRGRPCSRNATKTPTQPIKDDSDEALSDEEARLEALIRRGRPASRNANLTPQQQQNVPPSQQQPTTLSSKQQQRNNIAKSVDQLASGQAVATRRIGGSTTHVYRVPLPPDDDERNSSNLIRSSSVRGMSSRYGGSSGGVGGSSEDCLQASLMRAKSKTLEPYQHHHIGLDRATATLGSRPISRVPPTKVQQQPSHHQNHQKYNQMVSELKSAAIDAGGPSSSSNAAPSVALSGNVVKQALVSPLRSSTRSATTQRATVCKQTGGVPSATRHDQFELEPPVHQCICGGAVPPSIPPKPLWNVSLVPPPLPPRRCASPPKYTNQMTTTTSQVVTTMAPSNMGGTGGLTASSQVECSVQVTEEELQSTASVVTSVAPQEQQHSGRDKTAGSDISAVAASPVKGSAALKSQQQEAASSSASSVSKLDILSAHTTAASGNSGSLVDTNSILGGSTTAIGNTTGSLTANTTGSTTGNTTGSGSFASDDAEPPEDRNDITVLRFKLPQGAAYTRRFVARQPLKAVFSYLSAKGYDAARYRVYLKSSPFTKKELTPASEDRTLEQLKMVPNRTIILRPR